MAPALTPALTPVLTEVTTWHLAQSSPDVLPATPVPAPDGLDLAVVRAELIGPEFARFLYTAVGGVWNWTDRLGWDHRAWADWLAKDGLETWVAWVSGTPAGYVQLEPHPEGEVEVIYFGLLPDFIGRGLGGHLLDFGLRRAWDLADRHPGRAATRRVTVHTCSLDGPAALRNYQARGFVLVRTESAVQPVGAPPGPWPGSGLTVTPVDRPATTAAAPPPRGRSARPPRSAPRPDAVPPR